MARKTAETLGYGGLIEGGSILCPVNWQKAERAIIRVQVDSRDPSIGTSDYSKIIPREFTGYAYLYKDNYQLEKITLDFQSQEIYNDLFVWRGEIALQQLAQRLPQIEVGEPLENVEEVSEFLVIGGEILSNTVASLNIGIIDDMVGFIIGFFESLSSDDLDYIPAPYRPDTIYYWFPAGKATISIEFIWYPFSPVAVGAGLAELSIEDLIQLPDNIDGKNPFSPVPVQTFDNVARDAGYILPNECVTPPTKPDFDGGQCDGVSYKVVSTITVVNSAGAYITSLISQISPVPGKVQGVRIDEGRKTYYIIHSSGETKGATLSLSSQFMGDVRITSVTRVDGGEDVC